MNITDFLYGLVRIFAILALILALSACEAFNRPDVPLTLQAENTRSIAESTTIANQATSEFFDTAATEAAARATVSYVESINSQLRATARVVVPRTPIAVNVPLVGGTPAPISGTQLVDTVVAGGRSDVDGCAMDVRTEFPADQGRIYVVTRALNIKGGAKVGAEWLFNGQVVAQNSINIGADDEEICLWFYIDSSLITFTPGQWTARVLLDDTAVPPDASFTILAP